MRIKLKHLLFVYGSLKRSGQFHYLIQKEIELLNDDCYTRGILISLGKYPAMIDGIGKVSGELFSITDKGLSICNRIEGYKPGKYSFYYPVHKDVYEPNGDFAADALVYIINPLNISFNWNKNCDLEIGII
jgi:gamma-glutamylcyclotransferase (GGCT)/AIG2-like uncharacterized protein YtfP